MKRRHLLALAATAVIGGAQAAEKPLPENAFADAYNEWIRLRNEAPAGTISAGATRKWPQVKKAWRELAHSVV